MADESNVMTKEVFDRLLQFGVEKGASDIHFEVGSPPCYRIRGELLKAKTEPLTREMTKVIAQLMVTARHIDVNRFFPEQDISYSLPGVSRFRASVFRQRGSLGAILRVVPFVIRSFEELNLPDVLKDIAQIRRGLILVTGATGNGKSTTIASMIQHIAQTRAVHILTVEDPIEFLFDNHEALIIQREVGLDTHSLQDGMLAALRQDPDVIMLGEIRDAESANICLRAAETGHVVITTMHTPDAVSTIKRFSGFFEGSDTTVHLGRLAECLQATISLRLLARADGGDLLPAVEMMRVTHTLQDCIAHPDKLDQVYQHIQAGREMYQMQTFDQHLIDLVKQQIVTLEVAKHAATRPDDLERSLMVE